MAVETVDIAIVQSRRRHATARGREPICTIESAMTVVPE
jgi:hypothetical protein